MINLLSFIDLQNQKLEKDASRTTLDKTARFSSSIKDFCKGKDSDLRLAQTTDFILSYGRSLTDGSIRSYTPLVANECVERLRGIIRKAIRRQLIPNYDPVPAALDQLRSDVWHLDVKKETPSAINLNLSQTLDRIISRITRECGIHSAPLSGDQPSDSRALRESRTDARAVLILLFGYLHNGLTVKDTISIKRDAQDCQISQVPLALATLHNSGKICATGDFLFNVLSGRESSEQIDRQAEKILARASRWLRREGVNLDPSVDPVNVWLSIAAENGLPGVTIEDVISRQISTTGGETSVAVRQTAGTPALLDAVNSAASRSLASLSRNWYVLCSYSVTMRGEKLRKYIAKSGILGSEEEALPRLYNPVDNQGDRPGESSAVSRFVFLKATPVEAAFADRVHRDVTILRVSRTRQFAIVPQREIEQLQVALRDFRDDIRLVDRDEWTRAHSTEFAKASTVTIHSGPFKGREATIIDIKTRKGKEPVYLLSFAHDTFTILATRTALSLDAV